MNKMNKCVKFHKDSPSDKKVKLNLPSVIELSETAVLCTTLYRNPMQVSNFGGTFDQLFLRIFFMKISQKMPLYVFYTMVQKSQKWPTTQIKGGGGPALTFSRFTTLGNQHMASACVTSESHRYKLESDRTRGMRKFSQDKSFPAPPLAEMANIWTSITLPKIKIYLSFLDMHLTTSLAIGWPKMNWFGAKMK